MSEYTNADRPFPKHSNDYAHCIRKQCRKRLRNLYEPRFCLKNIFESGELQDNSVSSILEHTANDI